MENWLQKETTLHERDAEGDLLAQEVKLELLEGEPKILATPISRGEIQKLRRKNVSEEGDFDADIILKHCKKPIYTKEEVLALKEKETNAIVKAILSLSLGTPQKEEKTKNETIEISEELLKKKLIEILKN